MSQNQAGLPQQAIIANMPNMPTQECIAQWVQLSVQLSPFNVVIAIDMATFQSWTHADQQFILGSFMWVSPAKLIYLKLTLYFPGDPPAVVFQSSCRISLLCVCSSVLWLSSNNKASSFPPWAKFRNMSHPNCMVKPALLNCKANPSHFLLKLMPLLPVSVSVSQLVQPVLPADRPIRFRAHPTPGSCIASTSIPPSLSPTLSLTTTKSVSLLTLYFNWSSWQITATFIAARWKEEPQGVKDIWHKMAAEAKAEHMRKYPDYQYKPRKSSEKKRRMSKKKAAALTATALTAEAAPNTQGATVITVEPTYTITPMDNVDIIAEAKAFGQAMFNAGYDMTHGAGGFDGQSLFTEDGAAAEDEGAVAEYDDEHSNEFLDWIFS
jgi:HMG (high mobility group) box